MILMCIPVLCVLTSFLAQTSSIKDQISAYHAIMKGLLTLPLLAFSGC